MPTPLLETKLYLPQPRRGLVPRPRLIERLDSGATSTLMLVSAPAGFGKTTLLAAWLAARAVVDPGQRSAAWLSLDRGDNDPGSYWSYLIAALQTASPTVGTKATALLATPQPPPIQEVLTTLLNDLGRLETDLVLVLDDFHVIESREVLDGMTFLIDHAPPRLHLVIASRADPAVPLARLRARGELIEARAADLRFTPDEAAAYLTGVMGLSLTAQDVSVLEGRTEGWIAALQLAALSMQGRDDAAGFIADFAGDDRYVVDYLVEEVVQRQPPEVQSFLLQTSVLGRLSGPLCDAVTGQSGSKAMLETLDRANLFLVPLDDRRRWYRYHHLFADVLHARLLDERPDQPPELHRRASEWYERNGEDAEAIRHALASNDVERAADLVELAVPAMRRNRQEATIRRWIEAIPPKLLEVRPVLSIDYAGSLMAIGVVDGVDKCLENAERWMEGGEGWSDKSATMVVVDEEEFERLPAAVALYHSALSLLRGDHPSSRAHAYRALELVTEDDHAGHGGPQSLLGISFWSSGDLEDARRWYSAGMASLEKAEYFADVVGCAVTLADILIAQGRLRDAMTAYERGLHKATEQHEVVLRGAPDMHVGISNLLREHNDLDGALSHLAASKELGEHLDMPQNGYRWRVAMAEVRTAYGDLTGALDLLDDAERVYDGDFSPNVRPVAASRARVWITQGRLKDAHTWVHDRGLAADDSLTYVREYEHITLARLLLAEAAATGAKPTQLQADQLLVRLHAAAEEGGRWGSVIEILVLQALSSQRTGDVPAALASLEQAITLAEPEGYVRLIIGEGAPMEALLRASGGRGASTGYARELLTALGTSEVTTPEQRLVDPLSEREREVLGLLASDLGGPDIARTLVVSLNTVRTHTKNIYAKLGVNSRRAAVQRARELGLLAGPRR